MRRCTGFVLRFFLYGMGVTGALAQTVPLSLPDAVDRALEYNIERQNDVLDIEISTSLFRSGLAPYSLRLNLDADSVYATGDSVSGDRLSTRNHRFRTDLGKTFAHTGGTLSLYSDLVRHEEAGSEYSDPVVNGTYTNTLGLRLHQPLLKDAGPWYDRITLRQNQLTLENAFSRFVDLQRRLILDTIILYFNALKQEKLVEVAQRSVEDAEMHQQHTRVKREEGLVAQMDVSQADLQLARQQTTLIRSRQSAAALSDALKLKLNLPLDSVLELTETFEHVTESINMKDALDEAMRQRLDLHMLKNDLLIAEWALEKARNQQMPALDLLVTAETVHHDDRVSDTFRIDNERYHFRLGFSYTVGDRSQRETVTQARIRVRKLENELESRIRTVEKEVRDEIRHYQALTNALHVSAQALAIAEKNLELATESYREGLTGNLDLIKAQDDLIHAGTTYYSDILDLAIAKARIIHVLGRDMDPGNLTLNASASVDGPVPGDWTGEGGVDD